MALKKVAWLVAAVAAAEPWSCAPPKQQTSECAYIDRTKVDAEYGLYFTKHPKPTCQLGIINAGMPRTGSTLLTQLAEDAIRLLTKAFPEQNIQYTNGGFWRMDRHEFNHQRWRIRPPKKRKNGQEGIEVVQVKIHEWDSELNGELCDKNIVLLTEREVVPTLVSEITAFNLDNNATNGTTAMTCDGLRRIMIYNTQANYCWQTHAHSPLRFDYEELNQGKIAVTTNIATKAAGLLGLSFDDPARGVNLPFGFPPGFHEQEANQAYAGLARKAGDYEAELDAQIKRHFPPECADRDLWTRCFRDII